MNVREKLIVYSAVAVFAVVSVLAIVLAIVLRVSGSAWAAVNNWLFPPHATLGEAYLRHGTFFLVGILAVVAASYWGKAVQRILAGAPKPNTICPMCGALCGTPGRCLACGEMFPATGDTSLVNPPGPHPDDQSESS